MNNYYESTSNPLSKRNQTEAYANWLSSPEHDWKLFAVTVVFKPIDNNNSKARWEDEYTKRVLGKFRKAIEPNSKNQSNILPLPDLYYFERNEASIFKVSGSRNPFHIHAILPIYKHHVRRVWSEDDQALQSRLNKDLLSVDTMQSILFEPIEDARTVDWVRYITKFKSL